MRKDTRTCLIATVVCLAAFFLTLSPLIRDQIKPNIVAYIVYALMLIVSAGMSAVCIFFLTIAWRIRKIPRNEDIGPIDFDEEHIRNLP